MVEFDCAEYQKSLADSIIITDCERVPVPKCAEHQNYIFISYSHRDYKQVYHDLAHMYQAGVRFWYDEELTAGKDWDDEVFQKINDPHCSGVIFYISDDFFQSQSIYREILTTLGKNKKLASPDMAKNYFCVNLSTASPAEMIDANYVPDSNFEKELCEEIALKDLLKDAFRNKATYISFGSKGYLDKLLVQIRRNFNVIDLTGDDASLVGDYNGEMLNGKRTGYGICKYTNGVVYEGEWKENKYHGKGRLSYPEGHMQEYLEGTFCDHKANGPCVLKLRNGDCYAGNMTDGQLTGHFTYTQKDGYTYVGEMVAGEKHGKGKLTYPEGSEFVYYDGQWLNNTRCGNGVVVYKDGSSWEGIWRHDKKLEGFGTVKYSNGRTYFGNIKNELCNGKGRLTYAPNEQWEYYEGMFTDGSLTGVGVLKFRNGQCYEGGFLKGKYHGKGKLVYEETSHIEFYEGQWEADQKAGFGVMQFRNGNYYEGQWLNDKIHGNGVYTFAETSSAASYEGAFAEGKRNGKGTMHYRDGSVYSGEWLNDNYHGQGVLVYKNGDRWEGEWKNGKRHTGFGDYELSKEEQHYKGEMKDGLLHGKGKLTYEKTSHIDFYDGDWVNDKKTGFGVMQFRNGNYYEGQWLNDKIHGNGVYTFRETSSAASYEGAFAEGKRNGKGTMHYRDGSVYTGEWLNDKKDGQGVLVYKNGDRWEGEWENDKEQNGFGTIQKKNDEVYYGSVENGLYHGKGKLTYEKRSRIDFYEGDWVNGKKTGSGIMQFRNEESYEGEWLDDQYHGYGVFRYKENNSFIEKYEGQWVNSQKSGHGVLTYLGGSYFEGQWENDLENGPGTLFRKAVFRVSPLKGVWVNGRYDWTSHKYVAWMYSVMRQKQQYEEQERLRIGQEDAYQGEWKDGKRSGKGVQTFPEGSVYDGEWENNQFHGFGIYSHNKNGVRYEGHWEHHAMNGYGCHTDSNGNVYEGYFKNDKAEGQGTFTDGKGNVLEGTFQKNRLLCGSITLSDGTVVAVKNGKVKNKTVLDKLPEDTKIFLTKKKKVWYE